MTTTAVHVVVFLHQVRLSLSEPSASILTCFVIPFQLPLSRQIVSLTNQRYRRNKTSRYVRLRDSSKILVLGPILCPRIWVSATIGLLNKPLSICQSGWREITLGPVVRTPVSANPGLNFNPGFFFFLSKAHYRIIFSILFRVSSHQIVDKEN